MGLVEDVGVRELLPDAGKQIKVRDEPATPANNGTVVFHLPRHQDVPPLAPAFKHSRPAFVLADAGVDDQTPELAGAIEDRLCEVSILQQHLKVARPRRIEMDAEMIDRDRQWGNTIRAQPTRPKESVLDFDKCDVPALEVSDDSRGYLRTPQGNAIPGRDPIGVALETQRRRPAPKQRRDMTLLPECKADAATDCAICIDETPPEPAKLDCAQRIHRFAGEGIFE